MEQFIARKADILFNPAWKTATSQREDLEEMEEAAGKHSPSQVLQTCTNQQLHNTLQKVFFLNYCYSNCAVLSFWLSLTHLNSVMCQFLLMYVIFIF